MNPLLIILLGCIGLRIIVMSFRAVSRRGEWWYWDFLSMFSIGSIVTLYSVYWLVGVLKS